MIDRSYIIFANGRDAPFNSLLQGQNTDLSIGYGFLHRIQDLSIGNF